MITIDAMTKNEAVKLAGSQTNLARIFGITPQAVIQWPDGPLPDARLYELRGRRPEWFTTTAHPEQQATEKAESLALARAHGAIA
jgi:hypothetical protein